MVTITPMTNTTPKERTYGCDMCGQTSHRYIIDDKGKTPAIIDLCPVHVKYLKHLPLKLQI